MSSHTYYILAHAFYTFFFVVSQSNPKTDINTSMKKKKNDRTMNSTTVSSVTGLSHSFSTVKSISFILSTLSTTTAWRLWTSFIFWLRERRGLCSASCCRSSCVEWTCRMSLVVDSRRRLMSWRVSCTSWIHFVAFSSSVCASVLHVCLQWLSWRSKIMSSSMNLRGRTSVGFRISVVWSVVLWVLWVAKMDQENWMKEFKIIKIIIK